MDITVITPTYNRGENLKKLYDSLVKQTNQEFEWLIIDDGSTDNTEKIVDDLKKENKIMIKYKRKENGGKHTALNFGIKMIISDLTFIVDSDDYLIPEAIQNIISIHDKYKGNDNICGYSFLRKFSNNEINGKQLKDDEVIDDYINIRINGQDTNSDKAEIWKTKYLKDYPFPEFENEKFLGEDIVWIKLALKYKMIFLKKAIYISEYLVEGLTNNRRVNNISSPNGCYYRAKVSLEACKIKKINFIFFIKCMLQYQIYGRFANKDLKELYKDNPFKVFFVILYPFSLCIYMKWKK